MVLGLAPLMLSAQLKFSEKNLIPSPYFDTMDEQVRLGTFENITSILVARGDKLIFEKYYMGQDSTSLHNTRSATKSIATLLIGIAIREGAIKSEKDPFLSYVRHLERQKEWDARKLDITIEDLLTMSSILECDDNNPFSRGNEERMYLIEDWLQFFVELPVRSYTFGPRPEEAPYARVMSYCSAGSAALAEVIAGAVQRPVEEFAREMLFRPLGIEQYTLHYTPTGMLNTAGGSEYRSRDLLKLIRLLVQGGRWEELTILDTSWVTKATTPSVQAGADAEYGYLLWLRRYGKEKNYLTYAMAGNGGQKVLAVPELDLTVVITTKNYGNRKAHQYTDQLLEEYILPAVVR